MAGGRTSRQEALTESTSALELSASLQAVSAAAQSGLDVYRADYATLPSCSDACMEALLQVRADPQALAVQTCGQAGCRFSPVHHQPESV